MNIIKISRNPQISIILPTFNGEKFISQSINSVIGQTFSNWELIVIDDGSLDSTPNIVKNFVKIDPRIKYFHNQENKKIVESLNYGLSLANGEYIARIDDDDIWLENKLELQLQFFNQNPNIDIVGTFGETIDEENQKISQIIFQKNPKIKDFFIKNQLIHSSVLIKKSSLLKVGNYNKQWMYIEDFDLWIRFLNKGFCIANLDSPLVLYRIRKNNITSSKYGKMQYLFFLRIWKEENTNIPFVSKIFCYIFRFLLILFPKKTIDFLYKLYKNK